MYSQVLQVQYSIVAATSYKPRWEDTQHTASVHPLIHNYHFDEDNDDEDHDHDGNDSDDDDDDEHDHDSVINDSDDDDDLSTTGLTLPCGW